MKFLVVLAAFLAVACAEVRDKRGILAGPSGTIITNPGVIAAPGLLARSVLAPGLVAPGLVAPGLVAPGLVAPGLVSAYAAPTVLAAPGVTAGTVVAPGTTLVGPSTNGAPGAVITNTLLGTRILV